MNVEEQRQRPEQPLRVLVVEDNSDQRELISFVLTEENPRFQITMAKDGPTALGLLEGQSFDAILLDFSLPQMTGLDVLDRLQEKKYAGPVIMVTGRGDEKIAVEAMRRGAYDYILKTTNYLETLPTVVLKAIEKYGLKRHVQEASLRAQGLYEISLSVAQERRVGGLGKILVEGARRLIKTEGALLFLVNSDPSEVGLVASSGIEVDIRHMPGPTTPAGLLGLALIQQRPVVVEQPQQHPLWKETPVYRPEVRQLLSVPLFQKGQVSGALAVMNKEADEAFSQEDINTLSTLAVHAAVAIDNARFFEEKEKQAVSDSLTGLWNHRELQKRLSDEVERASRYGKAFSLLMIDIDHFKAVNDTHGHLVGDAILKAIVGVIRNNIRKPDMPARYGGEEFAVILPETNGENAKIIAERIRAEIDKNPLAAPTGYPIHLSVSVGIASFPLDAGTREDLIRSADQALYFAKEAGRNSVCLYTDTLKSAVEKNQGTVFSLLLDQQSETLNNLATVIDAKSPYTRGHTSRVVQHASTLAEALNISQEEKRDLQIASLLHNIGLITIPDSILHKLAPLSAEERKIIQSHPGVAEMLVKMLVKGISRWESILPIILYHHERFDGMGYPNGLKGEEIPYLARVLGVVEAYDAMTSVRPHRPKMSRAEAIEELQRNAGSQFDPQVIKTLIRLLTTGGENPVDRGS